MSYEYTRTYEYHAPGISSPLYVRTAASSTRAYSGIIYESVQQYHLRERTAGSSTRAYSSIIYESVYPQPLLQRLLLCCCGC